MSEPVQPGRFGYRPDIDGLRAVAVLSVVVYHAFPSWAPGGFAGVDVFFVISGFLISTIVFTELQAKRFSFVAFYGRRIRRIFPALAMVLIVSLGFGWLALLGDEYKQLGHHAAASASFLSNLLLWSEAGYFDAAAATKPLLHLWSLAIEEQFYLAWPLVIYVAWRRRVSWWVPLLGISAVSFAFAAMSASSHRIASFYSPATRFWELSLGGVLAYLAMRDRPSAAVDPALRQVGRWVQAQSLVGCLMLVATFALVNENSSIPGCPTLLPTVGTALVIGAGRQAWVNRVLLSLPALVWVGLISYPLYLWHWPILAFLRVIGSTVPTVGVRTGAVLVSVVLAWLTYQLIERPIRRPRFGAVKVAVLCAVMVMVGSFGYRVYRLDGIPSRLAVFEAQLSAIKTVVESTPECKAALPLTGLRYCLITDITKPPSVALFGDSHANRLFAPLSVRYQESRHNLLAIGGAGCLPFPDVETGRPGEPYGCDSIMSAQLDYLLTTPTIEQVVLVNRGPVHLQGYDLFSPGPRLLLDLRDPARPQTREQIYRDGLTRTLKLFADAGKAVVVVIDAPEFAYETPRCLDLVRPFASPFISRPDCRVSRAEVDERNRAYLEISADAVRRHASARLVNLQDVLCDQEYCHAIRDGKLLYRDADHLNPFGAEYVVSRLWPQFQVRVLPQPHSS